MIYYQDPKTAKKIKAILAANPDLDAEDFMIYGNNIGEMYTPQWYTEDHAGHYGYKSLKKMAKTISDNCGYEAIDEAMHSYNYED